MKIFQILLAIFLIALVSATAVTEEEQTPSFLQTSETNALTNEATVASDDDEDDEDSDDEDSDEEDDDEGKLMF